MVELNLSTLKRLLSEKNYIAAYLLVKEASCPREESIEHTGRIISAIIDDITGSRGDKAVYYRSLLLYIFEDFPALGRIYSRQLRLLEESKSSFDLLKNIRTIIDATNDKEEIKARIEETFEGIKEKIEDTTQEIKDGSAQKEMDDFLYVAGEGIKEGLRQFASFMKSISSQSGGENSGEEKKADEAIHGEAEPGEDTKQDKGDGSGESKG